MRRHALSVAASPSSLPRSLSCRLHTSPAGRYPWLTQSPTYRPLHDAPELFPIAQSANRNADRSRTSMPFFLPVRPAFPPTPEVSRPGVGWAFSAYAEAEREFRKLIGMLVDIFEFGDGSTRSRDMKGKQRERATGRDAVESYMTLRSLDQERSFLFNIPSRGWTSLLELSTLKDIPSSSSTSVTDILLRDLVDCLSSRRREDYQHVILDVFDLAASSTSPVTISDKQALDLFYSLPPSFDPQQYTTAMITRVFEAMMNDSDIQFPIHLPFLITTYQHLISPSTKDQTSVAQARTTWLLFRLIERLSRLASQPQSPRGKGVRNVDGVILEVLAHVAGAGMIPHSVAVAALASAKSALLTSAPEERADAMRVAVLGALVTTCFKEGWYGRGMELLSSVLPATQTYSAIQTPNKKVAQRSRISAQPMPLSRITVDYLQETVVNLLTFPTPADFKAASALLVTLVDVLQSQPQFAPRIPDLVKTYYTFAAANETSARATALAFVDTSLENYGIDLADRIPPRDMQPRLLRAYLQTGASELAKRLIRNILEHDRAVREARGELAAVATMETDLVLGIVDAKDVESLREVWRRAEAGWTGYSKLFICGSRTILKEIVKQFSKIDGRIPLSQPANFSRESISDNGLAQPLVARTFFQHVLKTFADIHLHCLTQAEYLDVKTYNDACRALGYPDQVITQDHKPRAPQTSNQLSNSIANPQPTTTRVTPDLAYAEQLRPLMHPSNPLDVRKGAAKQFIKSIGTESSLGGEIGSPGDLRLRHLAAAVALDACWPPNAWVPLLGHKPALPWSTELRCEICSVAFARWKMGELSEEYCLKVLRHLRSPLAKEIQRRRDWPSTSTT